MNTGFTLKFALKNLRKYKSKVILVLIGFIFSLSLLISVFVWADTSERLVISKFADNTDYIVSSSSFRLGDAFHVFEYLDEDELVDHYDLSVRSQILFNTNNKNDSYRYFPLNNQENPDDPILVSNAVSTSLRGIDRISRNFNLTGRIPTSSTEVLVTSKLLNAINDQLDLDYKIESTLNFSISRNFPDEDANEITLEAFQRVDFKEFKIVGILEDNDFSSMMREIYSDTIFDSLIIFPSENWNQSDFEIMDANGLRLHAMISIALADLYSFGIKGMADLVSRLNDRIKTQVWSAVVTILGTEILELVQEFTFSFNTIYLYLPLVSLSLLLSNFAASILLSDRNQEMKYLRNKGSTNLDLVKLFSIEFTIIAIIGIILGLPIAILLSTLIPNIKSSGGIDIGGTLQFLDQLQIDFSEIYLTTLTVFGLFGTSVVYRMNSTIYQPVASDHTQADTSGVLRLVRPIVTIVLGVQLVFLLQGVSKGSKIQEFSLDVEGQLELRLLIIIFNILWIMIAQYMADFLFVLFRRTWKFIVYIMPKESYIINSNFRRPNHNLLPLSFFIIFLISILTFSSAMDSTYYKNEIQTQEFLQGADYRIHTENTYANFSDVLESVKGIEAATPIHVGSARIVTTDIRLYAIDPMQYMEIGRWELAEGSENPKRMMQRLAEQGDGILISNHIADRLSHEVGLGIFVYGFEGVYLSQFTISGVIKSAPGLGLASSSNPELDHESNGWAIISLDYARQIFEIGETSLFLATGTEDMEYDATLKDLRRLPGVVFVNPHPITRNFIGNAISPFLPATNAILLFVKFSTIAFSVFFISITAENILKTRNRENAILIAIGINQKQLMKTIVGEFSFSIIGSILLGIFLGVLLSLLAINFFLPMTLKRLFVGVDYTVNILELFTVVGGIALLCIAIIGYHIKSLFAKIPLNDVLHN